MASAHGRESACDDTVEHEEVELLQDGLMGCVTKAQKPALTSMAGLALPGPTGVVLLHGASGGMHTVHMERLACMFAKAGLTCVRYTHISPKVERRADKLQEVLSALRANVESTRHVSQWILAGHSMGARAVCHYANDNQVLGLVLCSYPLHPPKKPDNVRDTPLTLLKAPMLWIRGDKDPFCSDTVFAAVYTRLSSSNLKLFTVEKGDHSLGRASKVASDGVMAELSGAVVDFVSTLTKDTKLGASKKRASCKGDSAARGRAPRRSRR